MTEASPGVPAPLRLAPNVLNEAPSTKRNSVGSVSSRSSPAWLSKHRAALGLSQEEPAQRVGTGYSSISRIASGRHKTSIDTLQRLAAALGLRFVLGFESGPVDDPVRELVST